MESGATPVELEENGCQIHRLAGDRKGAYANAVLARCRIVFHYEDGNAYDAEAVDYRKS